MEGQDLGPTIGSNGFGSGGAESVVELPPPTDPASPADATIQPAYAAPPESPAEQLLLPEYPAAFDPALAVMPKRRRPNRWLLIAIGVLAAILAVDGAGIAVNAALSSLYNPDRAVTDYFAAQSRGEVSGMMANATFLVGSDPAFFSSSAVAGMMVVPRIATSRTSASCRRTRSTTRPHRSMLQ